MRYIVGGLALGLCLLAGCSKVEAGADRTAATGGARDPARPWARPGDQIDSILPMPEYLRRFRDGEAEASELTGGAANRVDLARAILTGVSKRDSSALRELLVSRAEFGWLVFPEHVYSLPPYELDPAVFWLQLQAGSAKGLDRALGRYGGEPLMLEALECSRDSTQLAPAGGVLWSPCRVRFRVRGRVETQRLFGSILERDGRAKLLSYANDF